MLGLSASPALAAALDPAPVVAAERAFAQDGLKLGVRDSFLKWSAPEGVVLSPGPVSVQATYRTQPDDIAGPPLVWWPLWAGIARSGDLGFTSGPFTYDGKPGGYYFTVWKKQADGTWRWLFDGGTPSDPTHAAPAGSPPAYLPTSAARPSSPSEAMAEVRAREAVLAEDARANLAAAYAKALAPDGRVVGSRAAPSNTPEGHAAELATRPAAITFSPLGGEASGAGDLAWTYGEARWTRDGQARQGHYVRIWQRREAGWALVFDELLPIAPKS